MKATQRGPGRRARRLAAALAIGAAATTTLIAGAGASVSPSSATFTLRAGDPVLGTATEHKTVGIPAVPPKADIEIAIDTTGSMSSTIASAKADATQIVNDVQAQVPDTQFAVVQFRDKGDSPEYQLMQPMTSSAAAVQSAINPLSAGGGGDAAEAHNLVFRRSYTDAATGWRTGSRKFVIVLTDAQPHRAGSEGFAGCNDTTADPNGLSPSTELAAMKAEKRTLLMVRQVGSQTSTSLACLKSLSAAAFPTGAAIDHGGSLSAAIVQLIKDAFANVDDVRLKVNSASPAPAAASWITFSPASRGPVSAPSDQAFDVTATVPAGTPEGTYEFDIVALADGVDIGHQKLTIVVPEKKLTLTPATADNPIGTSHTVTAKAFDALGPYVGDAVSFNVTSGPDTGATGNDTTDSSGEATFTFTNTPPAPGTDTIEAKDGSLTATATKDWINSPPDCSKVTLDNTLLWPPNHKFVEINASGATDSDVGDSATLVIDAIRQDEPVDDVGDGHTGPDAKLTSPASSKAWVRAERSGTGDGRVYRVHYTATDTHGATCDGTATVGVPHDQGSGATPIDSAPPGYDSLTP